MWSIKASLRSRYVAGALLVIVLALGFQVSISDQCMPASSIEKTIPDRIGRWVAHAPGAAESESRSVPGPSVVKDFFRDEIDPNAALTLSDSRALAALPTLPPNTLPPVVLPFDPAGKFSLDILTMSNAKLNKPRSKDRACIDVRNMLGAGESP
jgi:multidrug efflux pump subunit AcrB